MNRRQLIQRLGMLAGILALAALSCSSISSVSNLFAMDTPTPTNTFTPSPTVTPSPTSTPTQTPTLTPTPLPTGSSVEEKADGSKLFTDYDNQFQVDLPKGWVILPLSAADLADILENAAKENPELKETAKAMKNLDPDVIRVMAFNKNSKYNVNGFTTNLIVTATENKVMTTMPMDFVIGYLEDYIAQQGGQQVSTKSSVTTNANDVEIGTFDYIQTTPTAIGTKVSVHVKAIVFRAGDKLITVQLTTPKQFTEELSPVMDQIQDSVKLTGE
jgi:hypothetical protein